MTNRAKQQKTVPVACLNVENESIEKDQPQDTLNFTDQKGLKQGVWKSYLNRKLWKSETYKDGQLSGKRYEYLANGEVMESEYLNGVRHGYYLHYEPHERFGKFVTYWENGKALWSAFP